MNCALIGAEAFLLGAVKILGQRIACFSACIDEHVIDGIGQRAFGHAQWAFAAMKRVGAAFIGFGLTKIRQHVGITPARQAALAPLIIVARMTANIDHAIDR